MFIIKGVGLVLPFFKKSNEETTVDKHTDELLDSISRHSDLHKKLNTITTDVVEIADKRDFVEHFKTYLGNPLTANDFIDVVTTKKYKHKAYKYIFSHHEYAEFFDDYYQVIGKLKELKTKTINFYGKEVAVFHDYDSDLGAVKMTLGRFWSFFPRVLDVLDAELHHDLLVVSLNLNFGICVEIEGLNYSMTVWGFSEPKDDIDFNNYTGTTIL